MAVGEWDERQLCPDGSCVGVIGPEGTCKVCGRVAPNWGDERNRGLLPVPEEDAEDAEDADDDDDDDDDDWDDDEPAADGGVDAANEDADDEGEGDEDDAAARDDELAAASSAPIGWRGRQLCPDGACIGLIGPDGRCKVCGKRGVRSADDSLDSLSSADSLTGASASGEITAVAATPETTDTGASETSQTSETSNAVASGDVIPAAAPKPSDGSGDEELA